jgi:spore germination protein YaaH
MAAQSHRPGPITPRLMRLMRVALVATTAFALAGGSVLAQSPSSSIPPPVGSSAPAPPASPTTPRVRALADREVFGFLPNWELADAAQSVDLDRLTTLAWFGVEAGPGGRLVRKSSTGVVPSGYRGWQDPAWKALMADAQAKGVRVVLTVERMSWDSKSRARTVKLLSKPAARTRLVDEIVTEVMATGADGVNLDFEPMPAEVRDDFTLLVRELRSALDVARPGLQLTFDITASVDTYDIAALTADDAADAVFLMAYDFRGNSAPYAASHSPLDDPTGFDIRNTVAELVSVADPAHVILGLPWYGRAWTTKGPEMGSPTRSGPRLSTPALPFYEGALQLARANGRNYDPVSATAWTAYVTKACDTCPEAWRQLWYDDVDGFGTKIRYALEQGLRGIGMWALGYTGSLPGMWNVIDLTIGDLVDATAPEGQASVAAGSLGRHDGLPVADGPVTVELQAADAKGGSGLAFVRLSNDPAVDAEGALVSGTTWPSTTSVQWSVEEGQVVVGPKPLKTPKPTKKPAKTPAPSPTPPVVMGTRTISVQWRDVAGNWSAPTAVDVWYAPEGSVEALPSVAPSAGPSTVPSDGSGGVEAPASEIPAPTPTARPDRTPSPGRTPSPP